MPRTLSNSSPSTFKPFPASRCSSSCTWTARLPSRCPSPSTSRRASRSTCRTRRSRCRQRRIDVHSGGVDSVLAAEANGRTRLVVNVDSLMPYTTKVDGNDIVVTIGQQPGADLVKNAAPRGELKRHRNGHRTGHQDHRLPSRFRRHRPRDRAAHRSAHPRQRAPGRQPGGRGLRRHRDAEESDAPLRRHGFRHSRADRRCGARRRLLAPGDQRAGRLRAARLSVRQPVHRGDQAVPEAHRAGREAASTPASA